MSEKQYTLKSAKSELAKLQKAKECKTAKIQQLRAEVKETNARIKELEAIYDTLCRENLQQQIAAVWFKEQKLSAEQIKKFLEISRHLHDKIDTLDVFTIVQAINAAYQSQKAAGIDKETAVQNIFAEEGTQTKEVATNSSFSISQTGGAV